MEKVIIRPFKARLTPINEWIRNIADIGSHAYVAVLIEVISRNFKKNKNLRCSNCGKLGCLKRDCR